MTDTAGTTDLDAEYEQLGRNLAGKCLATHVCIVHAKTSDPILIAAADRGRRAALEEKAVR